MCLNGYIRAHLSALKYSAKFYQSLLFNFMGTGTRSVAATVLSAAHSAELLVRCHCGTMIVILFPQVQMYHQPILVALISAIVAVQVGIDQACGGNTQDPQQCLSGLVCRPT